MILDMINGFGEMISFTVVTNSKILDLINDFTWSKLCNCFTAVVEVIRYVMYVIPLPFLNQMR